MLISVNRKPSQQKNARTYCNTSAIPINIVTNHLWVVWVLENGSSHSQDKIAVLPCLYHPISADVLQNNFGTGSEKSKES